MATDLATLDCLQAICKAIEDKNEPITMTSLSKMLNVDRALVDAAVDSGVKTRHVQKERHNYVKLLRIYKIPESAYYSVLMDAIFQIWLDENYSKEGLHIENTSKADSKIVGPWTRPDFTLLTFRKFAWTTSHEYDVITFEVKRPGSFNVLAVFEALSHVSAATRSYVVFPISEISWIASDPQQAKRVKEECVRHGVGLILVGETISNPKPQIVIRAARKEIDNERCSNFLDSVMSGAAKTKISAWK
jgi:predicted transcriptional regulator